MSGTAGTLRDPDPVVGAGWGALGTPAGPTGWSSRQLVLLTPSWV